VTRTKRQKTKETREETKRDERGETRGKREERGVTRQGRERTGQRRGDESVCPRLSVTMGWLRLVGSLKL